MSDGVLILELVLEDAPPLGLVLVESNGARASCTGKIRSDAVRDSTILASFWRNSPFTPQKYSEKSLAHKKIHAVVLSAMLAANATTNERRRTNSTDRQGCDNVIMRTQCAPKSTIM